MSAAGRRGPDCGPSATVRRAAVHGAGAGAADVVIVEPYLAATSTAAVNDALTDPAHRILEPGVAPS
ncbi:hypothetical protein [Streptomyces pratisoli]|uniref:hypothetical protein n=1 Tax=Streptomyces pratisoli TaxID=3139917 RepID=UPI003C12BE49